MTMVSARDFAAREFETTTALFVQAAKCLKATRKETLCQLRKADQALTDRAGFTQFIQAESAVASVGSAALLVAGGPITAGIFAVGAAAATITNGVFANSAQQEVADDLNRQIGRDETAAKQFSKAKQAWDKACDNYRTQYGDAEFGKLKADWEENNWGSFGSFISLAFTAYNHYSTVGSVVAVGAGKASHFTHTGMSAFLGMVDESASVGASVARGGQAANAGAGVGQAAAGASTLAITFAGLAAAYSTWVAVSYDPKQSSAFHCHVTKMIPDVKKSVDNLEKLPL